MKKNPLRTSFRSAIQATDSTIIGCNAKIHAASQAPGTAKGRNTFQNNTGPDQCGP